MLLKTILKELEPYQTAAAMVIGDWDIKANIYRALEGDYICVFWSFNDNFETEVYKAETVDVMLNNVGMWRNYDWCVLNIWT